MLIINDLKCERVHARSTLTDSHKFGQLNCAADDDVVRASTQAALAFLTREPECVEEYVASNTDLHYDEWRKL